MRTVFILYVVYLFFIIIGHNMQHEPRDAFIAKASLQAPFLAQ